MSSEVSDKVKSSPSRKQNQWLGRAVSAPTEWDVQSRLIKLPQILRPDAGWTLIDPVSPVDEFLFGLDREDIGPHLYGFNEQCKLILADWRTIWRSGKCLTWPDGQDDYRPLCLTEKASIVGDPKTDEYIRNVHTFSAKVYRQRNHKNEMSRAAATYSAEHRKQEERKERRELKRQIGLSCAAPRISEEHQDWFMVKAKHHSSPYIRALCNRGVHYRWNHEIRMKAIYTVAALNVTCSFVEWGVNHIRIFSCHESDANPAWHKAAADWATEDPGHRVLYCPYLESDGKPIEPNEWAVLMIEAILSLSPQAKAGDQS